jgi:hypothetical protein
MRIAAIFIALVCLVQPAKLHAAPPTTQPERLTLESPLDYQIFQRRTRSEGVIIIRGKTTGGLARLQTRLTGKQLSERVDGMWHLLTPDQPSHPFLAEATVPAGGWYRFEIQLVEKGLIVASVVVEHIGVGEVFVIAGQSNSTNYGKPRQKVHSGLVSTFDGTSWRIADDPQPGVQDKSTGGSFIPSFGDAMVDRYHVPVAVASVGFGGTSVREWLPKGDRMQQQPTTGKHVKQVGDHEWESTGQLFDGLINRINQLGPHGFRAVLWHQGESDAGQARSGYPADRQITGDQYATWTKRLIAESRKQAGRNFPWFIAQATYHSEKDPADEEFRAAQKSLWDDHSALPGPDTDQLTADYRNGVHFNEKGLQAHGKLWAEKVSAWLDPLLSQSPNPH